MDLPGTRNYTLFIRMDRYKYVYDFDDVDINMCIYTYPYCIYTHIYT